AGTSRSGASRSNGFQDAKAPRRWGHPQQRLSHYWPRLIQPTAVSRHIYTSFADRHLVPEVGRNESARITVRLVPERLAGERVGRQRDADRVERAGQLPVVPGGVQP